MSYESPAPTPPPDRNTFDTRLAYIQSQRSITPTPVSASTSTSIQPNHRYNISTSSSTLLNVKPPSIPSHAGCVLCSLVASTSDQLSSNSPLHSPSAQSSLLPPTASSSSSSNTQLYHQPFERSSSPIPQSRRLSASGKEVIYQDSEITIYKAEGKERLCSDGKHLIVVVNKHLENVYEFGPSDVPLLSHIIEVSHRILLSSTGQSSSSASEAERGKGKGKENDVRVGFVGSVMRDPQCPHAHLHAHAMIGPIDTSLPGATFWRRNMVFGGMNWWSVEDLRAEIREESSNNRVKSGYQHRDRAPIDRVPDAGSVAGLPNALDPSDYTDHPSPNSTTKPDTLSRSLSQRSTRDSSSLSPIDSSSKGKMPDKSGGGGSTSSRHSEEGEDGDEGYVAVDLNEFPSSEAKPAVGNRVERGGRI